MLRLSRRGQTALETLFIVAIIMAGIAFVVPSYLNENRNISVIAYVRTSASHACDYLNMGVEISESPYSLLNPALESLNGENYHFRVMNITQVDTNTTTRILVTINTPFQVDNTTIANGIKSFIIEDIAKNTNLAKNSTNLVYSGRIIEISVRVVKG
ncbi:hypothetical protein PAP_00720 [Palaeococcus pacificus DY20341]|uniref:Uncharacterized protein n=1 Tax=Palaeococcus pacificus DY20341 TaxID=1343739 RepID=A0A075LRM2_9EURY|nr:hypothetical protein [Palaeococcus pacificus]AIF68587.1 hypothetical protein PAP_00720 [Palaeococcus pacificus DY20341]